MLLHCMDGCFLMLVAVVYVESRGAFFVSFLLFVCWLLATCIECNLIWEGTRVEQQQKQHKREILKTNEVWQQNNKKKEGTRRSPAFFMTLISVH